MSQNNSIIICHDCGFLQKISHIPEDGEAVCYRCEATLRKRQRVVPEKNIEHTLALVIAALVIFGIANFFPIIEFQSAGHQLETTLFGVVHYLFTHEMVFLAGLVLLTAFGAPLLQLTGLLYVLLPINFNRTPPFAPQVYRLVRIITSWSMLEVLMLGIIVSVVKLSAMGTVIPSIALWAFLILIFVVAAILNTLDTEIIWDQISSVKQNFDVKNVPIKEQLINCHNCKLLCRVEHHESVCPRCNSLVHRRKPESMVRCTAFLIAAIVLYIPANLLPVMVVSSLGDSEGDTILSGIIYLATSGDMLLAIIVFIASMFVPIIKLVILTLLLISTYFKSQINMKDQTSLYRMTELIGRWSMVDIFVTTLMAALIQIQGLAVIEVGFGAVCFGSVVVLTILAAKSFDPRLIWDNLEKENE